MKQCITIQHLAFEDLGNFGPALTDSGFAVRTWRAGIDAFDPAAFLAADLCIVLGGPIGVYDAEQYPFLDDELQLIRQRLAANKPLLGICLGAQLIAAAAGARVYPGPAKEIGWGPVSLTDTGRASPLAPLGEADAPVLHWHGDTFDLPDHAVLLASTDLIPHQAFSLGKTLALQFHVEADPAMIEAWLIGHTGELNRERIDPRTLRSDTVRAGAAVANRGQRILRAWLKETGLS